MDTVDGKVVVALLAVLAIALFPLFLRGRRHDSYERHLRGKKLVIFSGSPTMVAILKKTLCSGSLRCSFRDFDSLFASDLTGHPPSAILLIDAASRAEATRAAEYIAPDATAVVLAPFWAVEAKKTLRKKNIAVVGRGRNVDEIARSIGTSLMKREFVSND